MKKITGTLIFILLVAVANMLMAQPTGNMAFSLKEAQDYALENNVNVRNAKIDVELARKKIWETTAMGLPQVSAQASYQHIFVVPTMNFPQTVLTNNRIPGKTIYGVKAGPDSIFMNVMPGQPIKLGVQDNMNIDLNVTQLIFSGQYLVGLQAAKVFSQMADKGLEKNKIDTRESVANSYFLVLNLDQNLKTLSQSETNLKKTLSDMKEMLKEGFIENTDVDQIQLTVSNLSNAVQTLTRQVDAAKNLLKFQMGIPLEKEIELTDTFDNLLDSVTLESFLGQTFDINSNINYKILDTQVKLSELNLKREKSNYLPTIAGFYRHSEKLRKADFDFTMKDIAGLQVNIPLFSSWQRNTMVDERKLELEKVKNSRSLASEGLKLEFMNAQNDCKTAFEKYMNEKKNIGLANKIYQKVLLKYKEGVSSSLDLTNAQNQYLNAQSNFFNASFTLLTAKNKLDKLNSKL